MRGLAYLEWRCAVNHVAAIVRSPARLTLWILYAGSFGVLLYGRTLARSHGPATIGLGTSFAEAIVGLYLGALGFTIALAAGGRVFAFRNGAEAILFSNAGLRPRTIAVWLQVRKLVASGSRWVTGFIYFFLFFAPRQASGFATARAFCFALLAVALQMSVDLPAFLLARRRLQRPIAALGWLLAGAGFGFGALAILVPAQVRPVIAFLHVDPGAVFAALLAGNAFTVLALVALLAALAGLAAVVAVLGDDALPELYAASQQALARRRPIRARDARANATRPSSSSRRIPSGALALVWKDWAGFRRGRGSLRLWLAACAFSALCGAAAAVASRVWDDPSPLLSVGATAALALLVMAPLGASLGLAKDLGNPLFWLSRTSLRTRIAAWTFARTWRGAVAIGLAPLLAGVVAGNAALAAAALPLAFAMYGSLQSLGVGLFALFPNPIDSRGPMMFVRTLATGVFVLPPAVIAIVSVAAHQSPLAAAILCASSFALEGWAVVELTSLRFAERGASLATLGRAG